MTPSIFRTIVAMSVVTGILSIVIDWVFLPGDSDDIDMNVAVAIALLLIIFIAIACYIVSIVGLLRFRWWGRPLYIVGNSLGLLALSFFGYISTLGASEACAYLSSMFTGATIVASYWTPISSRFDRKSIGADH